MIPLFASLGSSGELEALTLMRQGGIIVPISSVGPGPPWQSFKRTECGGTGTPSLSFIGEALGAQSPSRAFDKSVYPVVSRPVRCSTQLFKGTANSIGKLGVESDTFLLYDRRFIMPFWFELRVWGRYLDTRRHHSGRSPASVPNCPSNRSNERDAGDLGTHRHSLSASL